MGSFGKCHVSLWVQTDDECFEALTKLADHCKGGKVVDALSVMFPHHAYSHSPKEFSGRSFSALEYLPALRALEVHLGVEDEALVQIGRCAPQLKELEFFDQRRLTAEGFRSLRTLTGLETLDLSHVCVDDGILKTVTELPRLRKLKCLFAVEVTKAGFKQLANLRELEDLDIFCRSIVTEREFRLVSNLKRLRRLQITGTKGLTGRSLRFMEELPLLEEFYLPGMSLTAEEAAAFWKRHAARFPVTKPQS